MQIATHFFVLSKKLAKKIICQDAVVDHIELTTGDRFITDLHRKRSRNKKKLVESIAERKVRRFSLPVRKEGEYKAIRS